MPRKKVKEVIENEPVQVKEEIPKAKKVKEKPNVAPVKEQNNSDDDIDANTLDFIGSSILKNARKLKKEENALSHKQAVALSTLLFNKNKNKKYKA